MLYTCTLTRVYGCKSAKTTQSYCGVISVYQVMDDNKILTLASNERIPLTHSMRLLLEINHMNHCSPATVSRGGVIFVNADDIGWKPVRFSPILHIEI